MHDVVVVGAGSAGCVLAERLSRDPDRSVLLLERGPGWPYAEVTDLYHLPVGADAATVGRTVSYPVSPPDLAVVRGHGIGGSAAVNGAYFLRWHRDDFVSWEHPIADIEAAYAEVESVMSASPFADDELPDAARAFEQWWGALLPTRPVGERWPAVGVNRIHSNSTCEAAGGRRVTTAEAFLRPALWRPNLTVRTSTTVTALESKGDRVLGVRCDTESIRCDEVVLCAGTLGTAAILFASGLATGPLRVVEHREMLVHYRLRHSPGRPTPLLPTVAHTASGCEIRCYGGDFADYIDGVPPLGPAIGVAAMSPGTPGTLVWDGATLTVDLGSAPDLPARLAPELDQVQDMLNSGDFRGIIEPGSVRVDPVVRTSQHASGSLPMGDRTDRFGALDGVHGLRIVDGSILPPGGRSGPHATTVMVAALSS